MAISSEFQELAKHLGMKQQPGESDAAFIRRLDAAETSSALLVEAVRLGVTLNGTETNDQLRDRIRDVTK